MKNLWTLGVLGVLVGILAGAPGAQAEVDLRRTIAVRGTATIEVEADELHWTFKIRQVANSLDEAGAAVEKSLSALQSSLEQAELPAEAIRLSSISSGREFQRTHQQSVFVGFFSQRLGVITLTDLTKRPLIERILLEDERISIENVTKHSTREQALRQEALQQAVDAARTKAELMAGQLGAKVGVPLSIVEGEDLGGQHLNLYENSVMRAAAPSPLPPEMEKIEMRAIATVKFELQ